MAVSRPKLTSELYCLKTLNANCNENSLILDYHITIHSIGGVKGCDLIIYSPVIYAAHYAYIYKGADSWRISKYNCFDTSRKTVLVNGVNLTGYNDFRLKDGDLIQLRTNGKEGQVNVLFTKHYFLDVTTLDKTQRTGVDNSWECLTYSFTPARRTSYPSKLVELLADVLLNPKDGLLWNDDMPWEVQPASSEGFSSESFDFLHDEETGNRQSYTYVNDSLLVPKEKNLICFSQGHNDDARFAVSSNEAKLVKDENARSSNRRTREEEKNSEFQYHKRQNEEAVPCSKIITKSNDSPSRLPFVVAFPCGSYDVVEASENGQNYALVDDSLLTQANIKRFLPGEIDETREAVNINVAKLAGFLIANLELRCHEGQSETRNPSSEIKTNSDDTTISHSETEEINQRDQVAFLHSQIAQRELELNMQLKRLDELEEMLKQEIAARLSMEDKLTRPTTSTATQTTVSLDNHVGSSADKDTHPISIANQQPSNTRADLLHNHDKGLSGKNAHPILISKQQQNNITTNNIIIVQHILLGSLNVLNVF